MPGAGPRAQRYHRGTVHPVFRALPFALVLALAAGGIAYLGGAQRPAVVEATTAWRTAGAADVPLADAAAHVAGSAFREAVAARLGDAPQGAWLDADVDGAGLRVRVRAPDEPEAVRRADAVDAALAAWAADRAATAAVDAAEAAEAALEVATERLRAAQVLGAVPDGGSLEQLAAARADALAVRDAAVARVQEGAGPGLVPAARALAARPPNRWPTTAVTAGIAFAVGLGAGWRRGGAPVRGERRVPRPASPAGEPARRRPARGASAVAEAAGPALARFTRAAGDAETEARTAGEALASAVLARVGSDRPAVLLVVARDDGEGKTTVAAHLAEALARGGTRTLLVDASFWSPALAARYGLTEEAVAAVPGTRAAERGARVASTLAWINDPRGRHHVVGVELGDEHRLDLVPQFRTVRPAPGTAATLFGGFGDALGRWRGYEVVVVDTAALGRVEDTTHLLPFATGVVAVVAEGRDGRRARQELRALVQKAGARVLGTVVVDVAAPEAPAGSETAG